jgi:lambda family phage portal protein
MLAQLPKNLRSAWARFQAQFDARFQWQVLQTVIVSGECFVRLFLEDGPGHPLRLQLLGPEYLDTSKTDKATREGIEFQGHNRSAYWMFEAAPSSLNPPRSVRIPADQVLHIYRPTYAGDQRGVSWLAPILLAARDLLELNEAYLTRAKTGALFAGFIRTLDGGNPLGTTGGRSNTDGVGLTLEPGSLCVLRDGETFEESHPPDFSSALDPFIRSYVRQIAAGLNIPYEVLSGDYSQVTYASGRAGILEWRRQVDSIQYNLLVPQLCEPVFRRWFELHSGLGNVDQVEPPLVRWIGPTIEALDPRAEVLAQVSRVRAGLQPRSEVIASTGWDAEDVDAQIAADNARADKLGLVFDSDPRRVTSQGQTQQTQTDGGTQE